MLSTKRLKWILPSLALLVLLFGGILFWLNRNSPGSQKGQVKIKLVQMLNNGSGMDYKWRITGNRNWGTFGAVSGPGPTSRISLQPETSSFGGLVRSSGSSQLEYEMKLSLGPSTAPGQRSYTISIDMHGPYGAAPSSSSSASFSTSATSLDKLVVINLQKDTVVRLPGEVRLATVDGKPIVVEFGK